MGGGTNAAPLFALHTCPLFLPAHSLESLRILSRCFPLVGRSLYPPRNLSLSLSLRRAADLAIVLCMAHLEWMGERGCYLLRFVRDGFIRSERTINNGQRYSSKTTKLASKAGATTRKDGLVEYRHAQSDRNKSELGNLSLFEALCPTICRRCRLPALSPSSAAFGRNSALGPDFVRERCYTKREEGRESKREGERGNLSDLTERERGREGGREGGEGRPPNAFTLQQLVWSMEHNMTRNEVLYNCMEILVLKTYSAYISISHQHQHQHDAHCTRLYFQ